MLNEIQFNNLIDQGENLNESSIGEWAQHSPMNYVMTQRAFLT